MNFRKRTGEELAIDLTSLIDVVFILLLFFMVSTTFERPASMKITLPEASAEAELADPTKRLELVIDKEGKMYLNDQELVDDRVETLIAAFTQEVGDNRKVPLVLRADRETPHHFVVTAMDVAAQLGFTDLSIATDRPSGKGE
ncbi:MAG: biopolymer transporter ExbD [Xanthomonadales bacterium]|nr:biopolymer transporter ExbD [Xanthomonadales bacterium]